MKSILKRSLIALSVALTVNSAQAVVVFSDNFDTETLGTNLTPSNWTLVDGAVDIIGDGFYDFLPGNGRYIDIDGSTNSGGWIRHTEFLTAGNYKLSYDYAGNHRNDDRDSIGAGVLYSDLTVVVDQFHFPAQNDGFVTASLAFTVSSDQNISLNFATFDSDNNVGPLLDNVKLERIEDPTGVPEGGSGVAMLGLVLGGLGLARRIVRKN